jgi:hypothetical protein
MVRITTAVWLCPNMKRRIAISSRYPSAPMISSASGTASQKLMPMYWGLTSPTITKAPSIIRSPWAKFTASVAL